MRKWFSVFLMAVCGASAVRAQIDVRHCPADAKWVMHLDVKALSAAPMGRFIQKSLDAEALRRMDALKAMSGIDLTNDVDSVVLCGKGGAQAGGVMYASGRFDIAKLTAIAGGGKEFQNRVFGKRSLLSWSDHGKRTALCFVDPTLVVMSQNEKQVEEAVDLIDGKKPGMGAEQGFAKVLAHDTGRFFSFQANNLEALAGSNPQFQLFKQAEAMLFELGQLEGANGIDCSLALKAPNVEMAQQLNQAALGLQALVMLQAAQNPDAAALAQGVKVALQDTVLTVNLKLPEETLKKMMQLQVAQREAAQAARQAKREAAPDAAKQPERPAF